MESHAIFAIVLFWVVWCLVNYLFPPTSKRIHSSLARATAANDEDTAAIC